MSCIPLSIYASNLIKPVVNLITAYRHPVSHRPRRGPTGGGIPQAGGGGFLAKAGAAGPLLAAIERAEQATQAAATRLAQLAAFERLTPRERQLLQLIARGHKNQQIAQDLCISVRTVEVCRASLMKRLAVNSLAEMLLRYAQVNEQP